LPRGAAPGLRSGNPSDAAKLSGSGARRIALAPGEYALRLWKGTQAYAARVTVAAGEARTLGWPELQPVASPQVAGKGPAEEDEAEGLSPEAQAEYLSKYYTVGNRLVVTATGSHASVNTSPVIYQGRYRKEVDEGDFFGEVGRNDLAESFRKRRGLRWTLFGGAAVVAAGTVAYGVATASSKSGCNVDVSDPNFKEACIDRPGKALEKVVLAGLVGATVSIGLAWAGMAVKPLPVEEHELRRLADEHNVALRRKLAAPPSQTPARERRDHLTLYLLPGAGTTARGITLGVAF